MVAVTLASKDGSPIAWATWLASIVASKGTIIIDDRICMAYCASVSRSPFEISEIPKTLVLHALNVDRRQVLWFVRPLKRVDKFQIRRTI